MCDTGSEGKNLAKLVLFFSLSWLNMLNIQLPFLHVNLIATSVHQALLLLPPCSAAAGCVFGFLVCSVQPHSKGTCLLYLGSASFQTFVRLRRPSFIFVDSYVSPNYCTVGLLYQELDSCGRVKDLTAPLLIGIVFSLSFLYIKAPKMFKWSVKRQSF